MQVNKCCNNLRYLITKVNIFICIDLVNSQQRFTSLKKMGILTNASKSTIGLFDKNALRIILAINQSREFNYDHWYKSKK